MAISDKLQELIDIKQDIKEAIENKDIDMTDVEFSGYAGKIDEIETGGGTSGGYTLTFRFYFNFTLSNIHIKQANGNEFIMNIRSDNHSWEKEVVFENVTYIKWSPSHYSLDYNGITEAELISGKTLTNDIRINVHDD